MHVRRTMIATPDGWPSSGIPTRRSEDRVLGGDLGGRSLRGVDIQSGYGDEHRTPVELQLPDALLDVGQGPVRETLGRLTIIRARVPAPAQLLDRGDIDHAVVQVVLQP